MNMIHHLSFNCRDRHAMERFYTSHFGFKRARVFKAGEPDEFVILRLGKCWLELFGAREEGPVLRRDPETPGFKHLAFEVDDIESLVARLRAEGLDVERLIDVSDVVPGMRICFFYDPEGNRVELMQGWSDDPNPPQA